MSPHQSKTGVYVFFCISRKVNSCFFCVYFVYFLLCCLLLLLSLSFFASLADLSLSSSLSLFSFFFFFCFCCLTIVSRARESVSPEIGGLLSPLPKRGRNVHTQTHTPGITARNAILRTSPKVTTAAGERCISLWCGCGFLWVGSACAWDVAPRRVTGSVLIWDTTLTTLLMWTRCRINRRVGKAFDIDEIHCRPKTASNLPSIHPSSKFSNRAAPKYKRQQYLNTLLVSIENTCSALWLWNNKTCY